MRADAKCVIRMGMRQNAPNCDFSDILDEATEAELKTQAKKGIRDNEDRVKRHIVADVLGSAIAALRFADKAKKKKKKKGQPVRV